MKCSEPNLKVGWCTPLTQVAFAFHFKEPQPSMSLFLSLCSPPFFCLDLATSSVGVVTGESCVGVLVQIELHSVLLQQETHCTRGISLRPPSKPAGFSLFCCSVPERRLLILCSRLQEHLLYPTDSRFSSQRVVQQR